MGIVLGCLSDEQMEINRVPANTTDETNTATMLIREYPDWKPNDDLNIDLAKYLRGVY